MWLQSLIPFCFIFSLHAEAAGLVFLASECSDVTTCECGKLLESSEANKTLKLLDTSDYATKVSISLPVCVYAR